MKQKINKITITFEDDPSGDGCLVKVTTDPPEIGPFKKGDYIPPCLYVASKAFGYIHSGKVGDTSVQVPDYCDKYDKDEVTIFSGLRGLKRE